MAILCSIESIDPDTCEATMKVPNLIAQQLRNLRRG
jgi:hypothetical protein